MAVVAWVETMVVVAVPVVVAVVVASVVAVLCTSWLKRNNNGGAYRLKWQRSVSEAEEQ
jgi:hypothetical protein